MPQEIQITHNEGGCFSIIEILQTFYKPFHLVLWLHVKKIDKNPTGVCQVLFKCMNLEAIVILGIVWFLE